MICKKCGAQIPDNSAECSFCGAEYEVAPIEEEKPELAAEEAAQESLGIDESGDEIDRILDDNERNRQMQAERISAEKQKQLDEIAKRRSDKKKRQRRNKALVVLSVAAVAGAVAAGVNHVRNSKKDIPDIVVVSHEPTQEIPQVVTSPDAENPDAITTEAPTELVTAADSGNAASPAGAAAAGNTASNGTSWKSTGGGGSTGSAAAGLAASGTAGGSASSGATQSGSASTGKSSSGAAAAGTTNKAASANIPSSKSGYNGSRFTSALITGGEVSSAGGKNYMSFTYDGKTYYAKVSSGTTTALVSGKPMTINASKTDVTYNGSAVYEITDITNYNGKYVFAESGYKLLTENDLKGKTAWELKVGRNEIYARHGRQFKEKALQDYFNSCAWYKPNPNYNNADDSANLNAIELKNAYFILNYENSH